MMSFVSPEFAASWHSDYPFPIP